ncbi:hypothetical protein D3C76_1778330 [compost metagenome]
MVEIVRKAGNFTGKAEFDGFEYGRFARTVWREQDGSPGTQFDSNFRPEFSKVGQGDGV